jgi:hypothetical protein
MAISTPTEDVLTDAAPEFDLGETAFDPDVTIRRLIWLYLILWLIEGGLRRWFLPGLATPLLLVRDPLVVIIYMLAWSKDLFPTNGFILAGAALAFATLANALTVGHGNLIAALYGIRCDFLHVPLIFIMGRVLRPNDLTAVAKVAVVLTIPYTALLIAQFYQPQSAWVNRGVGGSLDGAGFSGAEGHFRPPGTFSFITGTAELYPLLTACWFVILLERKLPAWIMMASGAAILVAIPISISRTLFLTVLIVATAGVGALLIQGRLSMKVILQAALAAIIIPILALQLPAFHDGLAAFGTRWEQSTSEAGGFQGAIVDRILNSFFGDLGDVGYTGLGTGFSTTVGQMLLTSQATFGASESEWGRLLYDNGVILGGLMLAYRVALAGSILFAAFRAWQCGSTLSLIFASVSFMWVLVGQWGQATTLGAAVIGAGLTLAAASEEETFEEETEA